MEQPLYDVYFTGQLVEGADLEAAKASFAKMFKASPEAVAKFFSGGPQPLKRGIDKTEALKYKTALHKAGLMVAFKAAAAPPMGVAGESTTPTPASIPASAGKSNEQEEDWSIAPTGSDLLRANERKVVPPRTVDTSAIKLVSAFASFEPEPQVTPPPPNTSHISVAPTGEDLLVDKPPPPPPLPLNLDDIALAPPGAELEELRDQQPPINPDISGISLAAPGADLRDGQEKTPPPPPPDTDHIKIADS